jgi:uncharacterized membrane protein
MNSLLLVVCIVVLFAVYQADAQWGGYGGWGNGGYGGWYVIYQIMQSINCCLFTLFSGAIHMADTVDGAEVTAVAGAVVTADGVIIVAGENRRSINRFRMITGKSTICTSDMFSTGQLLYKLKIV